MAISVNRVTLVGRLGADPERRGNSNGPVVLRVATSEKWKSSDGERREKTEWHSVTIWKEPTQNFMLEYARKGDMVYVEGQLETQKYEKDGQDHYSTSIVVKPFSGDVQLQSKDTGQRDSDDRGEDRTPQQRSGYSSGRPGANRPGQKNTPAFGSGLDDDDIPF